ncbi:unnamed protein product [Rotaria socialis]|nr:unnamed protein product [Rotaria socialis]CAF4559057.1 unnamed protein product [Rotaria socialis]CAF4586056.1 unnamed protein product [Rotaria socialis]
MAVEENKFEKTFDVIASSFGTLNKLASAWSNTNMTSVEFMGKFKSELESLEKQVIEIVKPVIETSTSPTSFSNL